MIRCFPQEKGGKKQLELKAWNSVTKHELSGIGGWKCFTTAFCSPDVLQCSHGVDSRFPDFQELDLGPGRDYQDVTGTWELDFFIFEFGDCFPRFEKRDNDWANTATSAITGNSETWIFATLSVQTLAMLHPQWTTVLAIFQNALFFTISALLFVLSSLPWNAFLPSFKSCLGVWILLTPFFILQI